MDEITSTAGAMVWFMEHSSGSVLCIKPDGERFIANTYPDARDFFENPHIAQIEEAERQLDKKLNNSK